MTNNFVQQAMDQQHPPSQRRTFLKTLGTGAAAMMLPATNTSASQTQTIKPKQKTNVIVIFCDDLGYGDLGVFGHPTIKTPNLDRMASEGIKWTTFYTAASVCTPSRAGLMTGRLPIRNGMCGAKSRVLFPNSKGGLPQSEITIAKALKPQGYATACIGKWHLGHLPQYLPTKHGFDTYFGIPYSNDMDAVKGVKNRFHQSKSEYFNVPLLRDEEVIERPADQTTITRRYADETISFIKKNKDKPFFVYLAHNLPHVPLFASDAFLGTSKRGLYGDVIEEIDNGVGRILDTLCQEGLDENTMVVFTSDNGPWLSFSEQGGSAGLFTDGKGTTWEGGMRVPTIFWQPGKIKPGVVTDMGSTMDLFKTICSITGAEFPTDRQMDSHDLSQALFSGGSSPRETMFYYRNQTIYAARKGKYKIHFITQTCYVKDQKRKEHETPLLFNLEVDPSEKYNIAAKHSEVIAEIIQEVEAHKAGVVPVKDQLLDRT